MIETSTLLMLTPVVFVAGFIDSIAGGGGLLVVPALLLAGIPPTMMLGTNKCISAIGTLVSTTHYILKGRMLWKVVIVGLPLTVIGSVLGANLASHLDAGLVRSIVLIALPIAALITLIPKPKSHAETPITWQSPRLWILVPLIALAMGGYDGVFGPGTGSFLVMALYGIAQLNFLHSAAVARLFNLVSNIGALVMFIWHGKVLYAVALPLAVAGIAGHYLGSHIAIRRGAGIVRAMLALSVTILFTTLIWQHFHEI